MAVEPKDKSLEPKDKSLEPKDKEVKRYRHIGNDGIYDLLRYNSNLESLKETT